MPRHQGEAALLLFAVMRVWRASHVVGALVERSPTTLGSYQIRPVMAVLMNTPIILPLTVPRSTSGAAVSDLYVLTSRTVLRSVRLLAHSFIWPGPGRPARSGRTPDATPVVRTVLRSRVPVYFTVAPVWVSHGLTMAMKASCSVPPQVPITVTDWPARDPAAADAAGDGETAMLAPALAAALGAMLAAALGAMLAAGVGVALPEQAAEMIPRAAIAVAARMRMLRVCSITE